MTGAGDLRRHRAALEKRVEQSDDYGNVIGTDWDEQFRRDVSFSYAGGGETVMAARLEGRGVYKCRLRSCSQTRQITQDWRLRDVRDGTVYAIKEADTITDRRWVFLVIERGVPA